MSFHTKLLAYTKEEVIRLLRASSLTNEHHYHIDQVLLVLYPNTINIFLYTTKPDTMKQYLTENGFEPKTSKNLNSITMVYKDIINIKVMADREEYDIEKIRNYKISSITFSHVIKQMVRDGYDLPQYDLPQLYTDLEKLATYK